MSARIFDATEAASLGICASPVALGDLDDAVEAQVAPYLETYPQAVARAKALARALGPQIDDDVIKRCITALADTWETQAAADGIARFLKK